jgi:hypothetical protein
MDLNIPTGKPLVYEFDDAMNVMCHYYLESAGSDATNPMHSSAA